MPDLPDVASADGLAPLTALDGARGHAQRRHAAAGAALAALIEATPDLRREIVTSGSPTGVTTGDLATWAYPTGFAFGGAARTPAPFTWLTSRLLVVQWVEADGTPRTLLWEPSDHERGRFTPYFARRRPGGPNPGRTRTTVHGTVPGHLRALGIDPAEVDYVAFAHLQTQDLRRLLGTTAPAPDLATHDAPVEGWLPNAVLLTSRREWEAIRHLHPLELPWYQADTFGSLDPARVSLLDDDVLLGPGVALVSTPGRTGGHISLVLNTDHGVWVGSGNGVAADSWAPRASRIPGLRAWSLAWGREVVPHANGSESAASQYDAMMIERLLADTPSSAPYPQCLPTAELTPHRLAPGLSSGHRHGGLETGAIRGSSPVDP